MKNVFALGAVAALAFVLLLITGCAQPGDGQVVGGDSDEHGCKASAGYSWCEEKQKCLRVWEEPCTQEGPAGQEINNFEECVAAGNPVMESYPRKCNAGAKTFTEEIPAEAMTEAEARAVAEKSACAADGALKESASYNEGTKTWWIDLEPFTPNELCNPACVVSEETKTAETNWRCTGLVPEQGATP